MTELDVETQKTGTDRRKGLIFCTVLGLLAILCCGLLFPAVPRGVSPKKEMVWQAEVGLNAAIKAYYEEYGTMPTGSNAEIVRVLRGDNPGKIVFFESDRRNYSPAGELLDPWKQPYRIDTTVPGKAWIYSCGPNKRDDGGAGRTDDVVSGPKSEPESALSPNGGAVGYPQALRKVHFMRGYAGTSTCDITDPA